MPARLSAVEEGRFRAWLRQAIRTGTLGPDAQREWWNGDRLALEWESWRQWQLSHPTEWNRAGDPVGSFIRWILAHRRREIEQQAKAERDTQASLFADDGPGLVDLLRERLGEIQKVAWHLLARVRCLEPGLEGEDCGECDACQLGQLLARPLGPNPPH